MATHNGVDYSTTPPGGTALVAAGVEFVCRYLADDSRGITAEEVRDITANGVDIVANYEPATDENGQHDWIMRGYLQGKDDAEYAENKLESVGLCPLQPIYFSMDFDATEEDQMGIDDYLTGVSSVIGIERTGVYGSFYVVERCKKNRSAMWFWQTYAWSGNNVSDYAHIFQYDNYGNTINGTDVDLDHGLVDNYGQMSRFQFPQHRIPAPDHMESQGYTIAANEHIKFLCTHGGYLKTAPNLDAPNASRNPYKRGKIYRFHFVTTANGENWLISRYGSWAPSKNFRPTP